MVPLLLFVIGGLLASAQTGPTCATGKKTDEELLQIATHDLGSELREAAAFIVAQRFQERSPSPPLAQLEELTRSPSEELRNEIAGVLQAAYAQALQSEELTPEGLAAEIAPGETFALRLARARAVIDYLLSGEFSPELAPRFERLLGGGVEEFAGLSLDGGLRAVRQAVYVNNFSCILPGPEPRLKELAISGASHELRLAAARTYVDFHQFTNVMEMIALAVHGESDELRSAVRFRLARALVRGQSSDGEIYELARSGETPQLRQAAGGALGWRWSDEAFYGTLTISDIPRQSRAKAYSPEQALIIFAAENTEAHPELAQAAISPLIAIWNGR